MAGRALVTGAGRRLGREMAHYLGRCGVEVAVHYAGSADGAARTAEEIAAAGSAAQPVQADLLDAAATRALVERAAAALGGPLDVLVNSASIFENDTVASVTEASWARHVDSNLRAPVLLTQAFAAQAPGAREGADGEPEAQALVVNMVDERVLRLPPDFLSYTVAKAGLWAFTQAAARALAPDIRVNAIGPGPTLQGDRQSAAHFAAQRRATPLARGADPGEVTAALGYLLSARAVTGQLLCVDGGQHLGPQSADLGRER